MGIKDGQGADAKPNLQHVLIKWTGGKRRQARRIVEHFPRKIATYHEPFLGGGSVLYELLAGDILVDRIECGDTCVPLVELWQVVRDDPEGLVRRYADMWGSLRAGGKHYFREVRHEFNTANDPYLFFFLLRTCRNGLVRFNRDGEFNSAFHGDRPGMDPKTVEALIGDWGRRLRERDVRFSVRDYRQVATAEGDLLYLDPPYLNEDGQYYSGMIDFPEFFGWLRGQRGGYLLSLNGFLGDEDRTVDVPGDLYDEHLLLDNGLSPYERLNGNAAPPVSDSLYIRRRSPGRRAGPSPVTTDDPPQTPPQIEVVNKSAEIRALLEAEPQLNGPEVVRRLAGRGIEVDANLVRVVRHNLRRAKVEATAQAEAKICARQAGLAQTALIFLTVRLAGFPQAREAQVSIDDLVVLAALIGGEVTWQQLTHAGHALWLARYSQLTGLTPEEAEAAIAKNFADLHRQPHDRPHFNAGATQSVARARQPEDDQDGLPRSFSFGEERDERPLHLDLQDWGTGIDQETGDPDEADKMDRLRKIDKRWRR